MGQRLNIEIVDHEHTYANAYYHWDAFSSTALVKTKDILDWYKENAKRYSGSPLLLAIKMLESTGAGVNDVEEYRILNDPNLELRKFMPQKCINRNEGLLSITDKGMKETESWEEGRVTINIEEETILFNVHNDDLPEEYQRYVNDYGYPELEEFMEIDDHHWFGSGENHNEIPFDKIDEALDIHSKTGNGKPWGFKRADGSVVGWIE